MRRLDLLLAAVLMLVLTSCTYQQTARQRDDRTHSVANGPDDALPVDPHVVTGTLSNGLTYYVRKNVEPRNRAELRLVVNVGSILEDENQRGLAHFVEHMAFNGTTHFQKHMIVDYLESVGMRFGPGINAYTGFDETVYSLQIPTNRPEIMTTGIQILEDWAHGIAFQDDEIDKERGVVMEEWRSRRGAQTRIQDEQLPVLLNGSLYPERLPIGEEELLKNFKHETLRRFYRDWYRPELMAVVAVGDFDPERVEQMIRNHFGGIPQRDHRRKREFFTVPGHPQTLYNVASDPEATESTVDIVYKLPEGHEEKARRYRRRITEELYNSMFNERLAAMAKQANPPFLDADSDVARFVRTTEFYALSATAKDDEIALCLRALLTEAKRVREFGFTPSELEREKTALLRSVEQAYKERDKTTSSAYAEEYVRHFLFADPIPGIQREYELYRELVPTISQAEVNGIAKEWMAIEDRIIQVSTPRKDGSAPPTESQLAAVVQSVAGESVGPYVDENVSGPLIQCTLNPSPVVKETTIEKIGVTQWTLKNGIHIILKPTHFKNDEVLFTAFSPGGTSLVPVGDLPSAETASEVVSACGVGQFSQIQLQRLLADKVVTVSPYIDTLTEGLSGQASPQDVESLFQLVYLYFTSPRKDPSAFNAFKSRVESMCENRNASPEATFHDTITATITQDNPRFQPMTRQMAEKMDLEKSLELYRNRFADAGDFTFVFVGSFELDTLKPLIESYLGSLPVTSRHESWQDVAPDYPKGVVAKCVNKGIEPKSLTSLVFTGPFPWSVRNRYVGSAMLDVLRIRLRERLREEMSGTYGVNVRSRFTRYPRETYRIAVEFGSSPARVDELTSEVFRQINELKNHGPTSEDLAKVRETDLQEYEANLTQNGYWLKALELSAFNHEDPLNILAYPEMVRSMKPEEIQKAAGRYLNQENYVKVVLYPES